MTNPTITHTHGHLDDCITMNGWNKEGGSPTLTATMTVINNDFFDIYATYGGGSVYWEKNIADMSSNSFAPNYVLRYKTSNSYIKAKVELIFTSGTQEILPATSNTSWTVKTGTVTADKYIDKIRVYATSASSAHVYYDFILLSHKFTFPYIHPGHIDLGFSDPYISTVNPGRVGDIKEYGGEESPTIMLSGDMDTNPDWGTLLEGTLIGNRLYHILHQRHAEAWQWFTSNLINCKVVVSDYHIIQDSEGDALRMWALTLKQYERCNGSVFGPLERFGL